MSQPPRLRSVSRLALTFASVLLILAGPSAPSVAAQQRTLPPHFGFGLAAHPDESGIYGWMPDSGIAWDYAYQYLAGGANTGQGWETWSPNGTFASSYATGAAARGYVPMFPYYELFHTRGPCDQCDEGQRDLTNLNTPAVMQAYYANFALLMKRLGPGTHYGIDGFGGVALVNIEPDLSGYAQQAVLHPGRACFGFCSGEGNDPRLLRAAVASSGMADVAGYEDTYAGFNAALLHLRDLYAPNVKLGFDISPWATGEDVGRSTDQGLDAVAVGRMAGEFARASGRFDVLFHSPLDRDAGQYTAEFGQNRWLDRLNVSVPNFKRWEAYIGAAIAVTGTPMLLWQVPMGNQVFQSMNNTPGHYQDNRAEYIFSHVDELQQLGVIGVLFGAGNGGSSTQEDGQKDGVSNPPVICSRDGLSSGQVCNDRPSVHADDDGGFIRLSAESYYRSPVALGAVPVAVPAPAAPALAALTVELGAFAAEPGRASAGQAIGLRQEALASRDARLLVDFEVYNAAGQRVWQGFVDEVAFKAGASTASVSSVTLPAGEYVVKTGIFSVGWGTLHAWNDRAAVLSVR